MTCQEHRELEEERRQARRELEGLPAETPAPAPTSAPDLEEAPTCPQ